MNRRWVTLFWRLAGSVPVQIKIMGIAIGLVALLGAWATIQMRATLSQTLLEQLEARGVSIASDLAARSTDLILTNNLFALYELIRNTVENNADVRYAFITNVHNEVLVHSFQRGFPTDLLQANTVRPSDRYHLEILDTEEGLIRDVAVPIFGGKAGTVRIGLSDRSVSKTVASVTRQLAIATAVVSLLGVVAAYVLTKVLTKPILDLVEATRAVARGDLSVQTAVWADDEIGRLQRAFNTMIADLARTREEGNRLWEELKKKEEIRRYLLARVISAQEEERNRIARELHDEAGQALTSLMVGLRVLGESGSLEEIRRRAEELRDIAAKTLENVKNLAVELRPRILDDLGLVAALERMTKQCSRQFGIRIDFQAIGLNRRLPLDVEVAVYRIVQEALTNVGKHAQAESASVLLEQRDHSLIAIVEDDGRGFDVEQILQESRLDAKLGLYGMIERADLIGGKLSIESRPGGGTTVFLEIPLPFEHIAPESTHTTGKG
ncbi:MAG: histidine kinase [Armatimonadota bacterium]|nr:histidine kinase [Armatimonadota bacterium]MDR5702500.1 histidine kinase [Armatimonadota bacterium]MDR7434054.1 histidine kinase [Armatimonadota bacterium]